MYIYIIHVIIHVNNFHSFPAWRVSTWSQTPSTVIVTWPGLRTGCEGNNYFARKIFPNLINENISDEDWPTVDRGVSSQPTWRTKPSTVSPATSSDAPVSWINYRKIFFLQAWKISLKIFWIIKNVFRNCWLQFNICISIGICQTALLRHSILVHLMMESFSLQFTVTMCMRCSRGQIVCVTLPDHAVILSLSCWWMTCDLYSCLHYINGGF